MKKTKFEEKTGLTIDRYVKGKNKKFETFSYIARNAGYTFDDVITFYGIMSLVNEDDMTIELYKKIIGEKNENQR